SNRLGILSIVYNSVYADLQHVYCKDGLSKFRVNGIKGLGRKIYVPFIPLARNPGSRLWEAPFAVLHITFCSLSLNRKISWPKGP
ncbi:hypothetical protein, partial [Paenibacillus lactis]|uniref:hypothetical protein n=1 Tax=Paenibacillus lactis TaxID=228574 RepID=UPI003661632C